jgi:hypothetical protein
MAAGWPDEPGGTGDAFSTILGDRHRSAGFVTEAHPWQPVDEGCFQRLGSG